MLRSNRENHMPKLTSFENFPFCSIVCVQKCSIFVLQRLSSSIRMSSPFYFSTQPSYPNTEQSVSLSHTHTPKTHLVSLQNLSTIINRKFDDNNRDSEVMYFSLFLSKNEGNLPSERVWNYLVERHCLEKCLQIIRICGWDFLFCFCKG